MHLASPGAIKNASCPKSSCRAATLGLYTNWSDWLFTDSLEWPTLDLQVGAPLVSKVTRAHHPRRQPAATVICPDS